MAQHALDRRERRRARQQRVRDGQADLGADLQRRVHQSIEDFVDRPLGRVLEGNQAVVGRALFHRREHLGVCLARLQVGGAAEAVNGGLMAERRHGTQVRHPRRSLQRP